jgi:L-alanine-DL-glutamate epimerase-like enolase superfamily enzyme
MTHIVRTNLNFEREPMAAPWGFKGGFVTEGWQTVALLEGANGQRGVGLGVQGVLWSDPQVFAACAEAAGNSMMLLMTAHALRAAQGRTFSSPPELLDELLPRTHAYGKTVTGSPNLRLTFALNALVAVDDAAWLLWAWENGVTCFDDLIPSDARPALSHRNEKVVCAPAVGYALRVEQVVGLVDDGFFLLKIKLGSDPARDGDPEKMLAWDCERLSAIHAAVKDRVAPGSPSGHVLYYLDANGRYDSKERLLRLLDAVARIGALERTILLEEPFPEEIKEEVGDIPVRVVADESAHTEHDARERIELGYGAIALKPIAKTLSMSFRIARVAHEHGVPCFCADLTVNPILVDWNKTMAARLAPLPGLNAGALEANGFQNYRHWKTMQTYHPCCGAPWTEPAQGVFPLDDDFYARSGGLFLPSPHYSALVT